MMGHHPEDSEHPNKRVVVPMYHLFSQGYVFTEVETDLGLLSHMTNGEGYVDCHARVGGWSNTANRYEEVLYTEPLNHGIWGTLHELFRTRYGAFIGDVASHVVHNFRPINGANQKYMRINRVEDDAIPRYFSEAGMEKIVQLINYDIRLDPENMEEDDTDEDNMLQVNISEDPADSVKVECRVCCFRNEEDDEGKLMSCSDCLNQPSEGIFYPRLEHESLCEQGTRAPTTAPPTTPPHLPVPIPSPDRCKVKKPFQPIPVRKKVFGETIDVCPILATIAGTVIGTAGLSAWGCAGVGVSGAGACEVSGLGPENPAADVCAAVWVGFAGTCLSLIWAGVAVTSTTFLAYAGCEAWCPPITV